MIKNTVKRLIYLCEIIPPLISAISEKDFSNRPTPTNWSKKEILGHLIDSATNNHQRFVRVQFEDTPFISYDADKWNDHSYYNSLNTKQLLEFWTSYNKHLAALMEQIPQQMYNRNCKVGEQTTVNLKFIMEDYVVHLEHHLKQIVNYS